MVPSPLPSPPAKTFALALVVWVGTTAIGFIRHGVGFLSFFVPSGAPVWSAPLLVMIELISYLSRPVSLALRLFANMLVGHTMLKVLGGFVFAPLARVLARGARPPAQVRLRDVRLEEHSPLRPAHPQDDQHGPDGQRREHHHPTLRAEGATGEHAGAVGLDPKERRARFQPADRQAVHRSDREVPGCVDPDRQGEASSQGVRATQEEAGEAEEAIPTLGDDDVSEDDPEALADQILEENQENQENAGEDEFSLEDFDISEFDDLPDQGDQADSGEEDDSNR